MWDVAVAELRKKKNNEEKSHEQQQRQATVVFIGTRSAVRTFKEVKS